MPRGLGIPLVGEVEPERALDDGGLQREARRALELLGELAANRVGQVHLAALQRGQPGRLVGDDAQDQPLHARRLPPVLLERLEDQLHARREGDELVGPRADRGLLEALLPHALHVLPRHDPARAGGARVEREEIGPGLLEPEAHASRVRCLHRGDAILEPLARGATVAIEGELHVLRGDRRAVVEAGVLSQDELVREPVLGHRPRLRQARRLRPRRHGLHHGVVQRVEHHEGRDHAGRLGRVEPGGRQRDVHAPGELAFRGRVGPRGQGHQDEQRNQGRSESASEDHGWPPCRTSARTGWCADYPRVSAPVN